MFLNERARNLWNIPEMAKPVVNLKTKAAEYERWQAHSITSYSSQLLLFSEQIQIVPLQGKQID